MMFGSRFGLALAAFRIVETVQTLGMRFPFRTWLFSITVKRRSPVQAAVSVACGHPILWKASSGS